MRIIMGSLVLLASASACTSGGGDGASYPSPYPLGQALVIGESGENDDGDGQLVTVDASCDTEACAAVRERCGDQACSLAMIASAISAVPTAVGSLRSSLRS